MAKKKKLGRKLRLLMRTKQNRRVPAWVMQRTMRRFLRHPKQRHWRRGRLKV